MSLGCVGCCVVFSKCAHLGMLQKQHDTDLDYEKTPHHEEDGIITPKSNSESILGLTNT